MPKENVEVVRRALEASAGEEPRAVLPYLDPEVEIDDTDIPDADDYQGHGAYFEWLARWDESWESSRMEDVEVLPGGEEELVVALFRMVARGRGSGVEVERKDALVFKLRDSKIMRIGYYNDQAQALEAAGLSE